MTPGTLSIAQVHRDIIAHSYRLMRPTRTIACMLGLSSEEVNRVGMAALVHDVGKFAMPKTILCKPGSLTVEEWAEMHRHPEIGHQVLSLAGGDLANLGPIVVAHHERWDGGGYPKGLAKDAIPLEARILSVVDAYDAMTSLRIYRKPFSHEEARAELERCSGHQFDPTIVSAYLQVQNGRESGGHIFFSLDSHHLKSGGSINPFVRRYLFRLAALTFPARARTQYLVGNRTVFRRKRFLSKSSIHQETDRHD